MEPEIPLSRFPVLTFFFIGVLFVLADDLLASGLMSLAQGPRRHEAVVLAQVWNVSGPALWLLVIALCFLLASGGTLPTFTRGRWLCALAVLYLFHLPLTFLPVTVLGRWTFAIFLLLGSCGTVFAIWLLMRRWHSAGYLLLAIPLLRIISWAHLHPSARTMAAKLFALAVFPLIGWWFRDVQAGDGSKPPRKAV